MDLFSKFTSQFKKEDPAKPEVQQEPAKEPSVPILDQWEAYMKINGHIPLRDFKMLVAREATIDELKTMSEFEKKQRRQGDKQKVKSEPEFEKPSEMVERLLKEKNMPPEPIKIEIDLVSPLSEEQIILENKELAKKQGFGYHSEKMTTEELKDKYGVDVSKEHAKLKNNLSPEQFFKEVMDSPVNYDSMPQGMKEAQERNGIKDHGLELFNKLDEQIVKEKKLRIFKKDFPTPVRTQTTVQRSFVGIDNGVSGSVGIIYEDGTYEFFVTPVKKEQDYTKAKKMINRVQPLELAELFKFVGEGSMVMIERPMINSTRFNASMSAIRCFEATITILETLGLPYQVEDSKAWQKALLPIGITGDELKVASKNVGNRLFPNTKLILHSDCDGMLIANYCKSKYR